MSPHLTTDVWVLIATASTVINIVAMRWCMPTPKAKRQISFAPLAGCIFLVPVAATKGYSLSHSLYMYSFGLLMFVIMLAPVRKKVAADILEQEKNPWIKVSPNIAALWWIGLSFTACTAAMIYLWPFIE
ncbi:MAG: hypothetical protein LBV34_24490 [Nocardiopsaceae bacterium]|jgi:hypothetical protein|nr:hypothetical protein [Nocardiopsaceae bacterium]